MSIEPYEQQARIAQQYLDMMKRTGALDAASRAHRIAESSGIFERTRDLRRMVTKLAIPSASQTAMADQLAPFIDSLLKQYTPPEMERLRRLVAQLEAQVPVVDYLPDPRAEPVPDEDVIVARIDELVVAVEGLDQAPPSAEPAPPLTAEQQDKLVKVGLRYIAGTIGLENVITEFVGDDVDPATRYWWSMRLIAVLFFCYYAITHTNDG